MKVLLLVHGLPVGGTEKVVVDLSLWMRKKGVSVIIGCLDQIGPLGISLQEEGFHLKLFQRKPGFDRTLPIRLAAFASREKCDLVHAHQYTPFFYAALAKLLTKFSLVFTEHGRFYPDVPNWKRRIFNRIIGKNVDWITAVSQEVRKSLEKTESFPPDHIEVLHNGIDLSIFPKKHNLRKKFRKESGIPDEALVIGTVARLNVIKNQKFLIEAFHVLRKSIPGIYLLIIGDGPERFSLQTQVKALGLHHEVLFVGEQRNIPEWFNKIDIFALSSLSEGMPMTLLESMAAKVPIITTDVGGIREMLVPNKEALLIKSGDIKAFSEGMKKLIQDPFLRNELSEHAKMRVTKEFSLEVICRRYLEIYGKVTEGG